MRKDLMGMAKMMGKMSMAKKEGKLPTYEASYTEAVANKWKDKGGKAAYIKAAKAYNQKKYGTTNPSADSSKDKITRAELASRKSAADTKTKADAATAAAAKAAAATKAAKAAKATKAAKADLDSRTTTKKKNRKEKKEVVSKDGETKTITKTKLKRDGTVKRTKIKVKKA